MKFGDVFEGDVTDLDVARKKKTEDYHKKLNQKIQEVKAKRFAGIDMAIAAALDTLTDQFGGDRKKAEDVIKAHIDDMFVLMDLERQ
jgi:hypothetical protein